MMKSLKDFPSVIFAKLSELRRVEPTPNNARLLLDVIDSSRQSVTDWQEMFVNITTREGMYDLIKKRDDQWNNQRGFCYGIYAGGILVGRVRAFNFDLSLQTAEIGYWLADEFVGHGVMTDAVNALVDVLFDYGFERVELEIDAGNTRSENVARRCGFVLEGRLRRKSWARAVGGVCDLLIYSKLKMENEKNDQTTAQE